MNVLERLAGYARERVEAAKAEKPLVQIREEALALPKGDFAFEQALRKKKLSFICECKKASPSKGLLREIAAAVNIPCLRKDFTVDEYMIYEAKLLGAAAVLLICALLTEEQIRKYLAICDKLGLSALVEAHDEAEVKMALNAGARIIGVNNRNLKDFSVDLNNSANLRELVPADIIFVAESGIKEAADVKAAVKMGASAVLVGEALMRAEDKNGKLAEFYAAADRVKESLQ